MILTFFIFKKHNHDKQLQNETIKKEQQKTQSLKKKIETGQKRITNNSNSQRKIEKMIFSDAQKDSVTKIRKIKIFKNHFEEQKKYQIFSKIFLWISSNRK
jgi:hypothetical protein